MSYFNRPTNPNASAKASQNNHSTSTSHGYTVPGLNRYKKYQYREAVTQKLQDYGPYPFATNIDALTKANTNFRTALWTGDNLQVTLMSIPPGGEIGLEMHPNLDQFLRLEQGKGLLMMGDNSDTPSLQQTVGDGYAFVVPAGTWHNLVNIGTVPIKLYSIYAPPQHPFGTVHPTKADADAAEMNP